MKLTIAAILFTGLVSAPAALAQEAPGAGLFQQRCALCHKDEPAAAPTVATLKTHAADAIVEKMTNGTMAPMSAGLSPDDIRAIAVFLAPTGGAPAAASGLDSAAIGGLVQQRCAMCHTDPPGAGPAMATVKAMAPEAIADKLTNGSMAPMAAGISPQQVREISVFLSGKPLPANGDLPEVKP